MEKMSGACARYNGLEGRLILGRERGTITEDEEAELLEEMGDLWWELTDKEMELANQRAAKYVEKENKKLDNYKGLAKDMMDYLERSIAEWKNRGKSSKGPDCALVLFTAKTNFELLAMRRGIELESKKKG